MNATQVNNIVTTITKSGYLVECPELKEKMTALNDCLLGNLFKEEDDSSLPKDLNEEFSEAMGKLIQCFKKIQLRNGVVPGFKKMIWCMGCEEVIITENPEKYVRCKLCGGEFRGE